MQILKVDPRTDSLWLQLIQEQQSAIFHTPEWINAVMTTYDWIPEAYIVLDEQDQPVAGLPICTINDIRGKRVVCFPFSDACDPIAHTEEHWTKLLDTLLELDLPIIVRALHNEVPVKADVDKISKQAKWHGMDLNRSLDDIWASLHSSARRAIRKAEKSGITTEIDNSHESMRAYFEMHLKIRKYKYRLLAQPFALFENILAEVIDKGKGFILNAEHDGEIIASNIYLEWKDTLVYKFSASNFKYMNYRPTDLLIWNAIKYAKEHDFIFLDFGLSDFDQDGLIGFKRKYATEEKTINFLRYEPSMPVASTAQQQASKIFPKLTDLFTEHDVPDTVTETAGDILYKFFG